MQGANTAALRSNRANVRMHVPPTTADRYVHARIRSVTEESQTTSPAGMYCDMCTVTLASYNY